MSHPAQPPAAGFGEALRLKPRWLPPGPRVACDDLLPRDAATGLALELLCTR